MARKEQDKEHYVDNKEFLKAIKEHRSLISKAKKNHTAPPQISDYIGDCIMKIAKGLSNKPNFNDYPFKEEMVSDGIENCLMYIDNFNPAKSKNPFAYFTQIIFFAFLRRISKEKKHLYTKYKAIEQSMLFFQDEVGNNESGGIQAPTKYCSEYSDEYMHEFMRNFENTKTKKKEKAEKTKKANLDKFIDENLKDDENGPQTD